METMLKEKVKQVRHIAYICDENYLIPTIVSIQSLIDNLHNEKEIHYVIHVCTFESKNENWQKILNMENKNVKIQIINLDFQKYEQQYDKIIQKTYVSKTALLKFELSNIFPTIDELLYLDCDIIINHSIDSIFDYDINDYALAAVFDMVFYLAGPHDSDPMAIPDEFYFNSGVMLLNLRKFRKRNISDQLWKAKFDLIDSPRNVMNLMDQNAFNEVLSDDCLPLPICFNCPNQYIGNINMNIERINHLYKTNYQDTIDLSEKAVIIHYIGRKSKPWIYETCACREIWDCYCQRANIDLISLHRLIEEKQEMKNVSYYWHKVMNLLKTKGFKETCRFVWYKAKLKFIGR